MAKCFLFWSSQSNSIPLAIINSVLQRIYALMKCRLKLSNIARAHSRGFGNDVPGNKSISAGVHFLMFVTSRWFPPIFALLQTVRHLGLIGYAYWVAAQREKQFDVGAFLQRDLALPLFEPSGFCSAFVHYTSDQFAAQGLDFPTYMGAILLQSAMNGWTDCVASLTTPRGQILTAAFVPPVWFVVGLSIRRLAQRRWRRKTTGMITPALVSLGLIPLPFGLLGLLLSFGLLYSDVWHSVRVVGLAFWTLYLATLAAERLRVRPFDQID